MLLYSHFMCYCAMKLYTCMLLIRICFYAIAISVAEGCQLTESLGRVTDYCCADVSGVNNYNY